MKTGMASADAAVAKDFLASFSEMLRSLEGDAEGRYRALMGVLAVAPELADDAAFEQMRREVVLSFVTSLILDAKRASSTRTAEALAKNPSSRLSRSGARRSSQSASRRRS